MIRVELVKLFRRPRTYVMTGLLCGLPFIVAVFLALGIGNPVILDDAAIAETALHRSGALDDTEFEAAKQRVLRGEG